MRTEYLEWGEDGVLKMDEDGVLKMDEDGVPINPLKMRWPSGPLVAFLTLWS